MAVTRYISAQLRLEGEQAYRAGMQSVQNALKMANSEAKLLDSTFKGQQNTMEALTQRHSVLTRAIEAQKDKLKLEADRLKEVQSAQQRYTEGVEAARRKLQALETGTDDAGKGTKEYKDAVEEAKKALEEQESKLQMAEKAFADQSKAVNDAQIKLNTYNEKLSQNRKHIAEAEQSSDKCARSIDGMGKAVKGTTKELHDMGSEGANGFAQVASALAAAGLAKGVNEIADALMACVDASIDFESAMAGVAKTTDMYDSELAAMGDAFKRMSMEIPMSASGLAHIAESAGQLGIAKENMTAFTEIMAKLGTATDMTATEAATMLAQFSSITGMNPEDYDRLGSVVVALGNNFSTTEKKITEMAQGLAGAGAAAGMSEAEIMAFSASVTSLGIESGTGASNMSKLLSEMQMAVETGEGLEQWAAAAGMTAGEFSRLWGQDAAMAVQAFFSSVGTGNESMLQVLDSLGIHDVRMQRMIQSLAGAEQKNGALTRALGLSNTAWQENNALTKEAETRYQTTESKMQLFRNGVEALKIAVGDELTPVLGNLASVGAGVTQWAAEFVQQNEWLVPVIAGVVAALGALTASVVGVTVVIPVLTKAWAALTATFAANPIGLVITALVGLTAGIVTAVSAAKKGAEEMTGATEEMTSAAKGLEEAFSDADAAYIQSISDAEGKTAKVEALAKRLRELEDLQGTTELNQEQWMEWNALLSAIVEEVPELGKIIDLQTGAIDGGTEALMRNTSAWRENALEQAKQNAIKDKYDAYGDIFKQTVDARVQLRVARAEMDMVCGEWYDDAKTYASLLDMTMDEFWEAVYSTPEESANTRWMQTVAGVNDGLMAFLLKVGALAPTAAPAVRRVMELEASVADYEAAMAQAEEEIDVYGMAIDELFGKYEQGAEAMERMTDEEREQVRTLVELEDEIARSMMQFDEVYAEALRGLNSTINGFKKIEDPLKVISAADSEAALQSQMDFLTKYQANMQALKAIADENGIELDAGMLAKLSDGSEDSAAIAAGMVEGGADAIASINEKYKQVGESKENMSAVLADMQTDFFAANDAMLKKLKDTVDELNQSEQAAFAGKDTIDAFNASLLSGSAYTRSVVSQINAVLGGLGTGFSVPDIPRHRPGHASGLDYVPYDEYPANLHKGERVLTALQARAMDAQEKTTYGYPSFGGYGAETVSFAIDYDRLGAAVARSLSGVSVNIDGEKAGELLEEHISRGIARGVD